MTELYRSFAPDLEIVRTEQGGDGYTVQGIAVPYDKPQRIDATLVESFARGAFNKQLPSLAQRTVPFTRNHMAHGGEPIGRIVEARDDAKGLWVSMRVSATQAGEETLTLIRDQVLSELSIGFRLLKPTWSKTLPDGTVQRVKAELTEVASVMYGAYGQGAKVLAVRSVQDDDDEADADAQQAAEVAAAEARARTARAALILGSMPMVPAAARLFAS